MDYDGIIICENLLVVYWCAIECTARILVSNIEQDRSRVYIPCVRHISLAKNIANSSPAESGLQALDASPAETSSRPLTRRTVYDRLHYLLRHLLDLIPTLSSTLEHLLVQNFPHKRQNTVSQITYIRNILRITEYCPELADKILATVVDRSIQIDVRNYPEQHLQ
jgi:hypothetical protein